MSETVRLPSDWETLVLSGDWNPEDPTAQVRTVTTPTALLPESFFMAIQTPAMATEAEPPFIFVNFWVTESEGIQLSSVTGGGANWIKYLSEVVARFPPTQWAGHARRLAIEFVSEPESRPTAEATEVEKVARQKPVMVAVGPDRTRNLADAGAQHRRKITPEHLQQVAAIYTKAQDAAEPPTRTVSDHFGVSHSTAAKWVGAARKAALLPPVKVAND